MNTENVFGTALQDELAAEILYADETEDAYGHIPYELIHILIRDAGLLRMTIMGLREIINGLTPEDEDIPYPMTAQDIPGTAIDGHPAMKRYQELFGTYEPYI